MQTDPIDSSSPMTGEQRSELTSLCQRTGEKVEDALTRDQAAARIETLKSLGTLPCR